MLSLLHFHHSRVRGRHRTAGDCQMALMNLPASGDALFKIYHRLEVKIQALRTGSRQLPRSDHHSTRYSLKAKSSQWLKHAQELMSSTASNYDVTKLATGQAVAAIALFFASLAAGPTIFNALRTSSLFIGISLLYGIMMFASSYVEEEQHFWYWATTAWLMLLWIKWYVYIS